jgi:hypothetical protein
LEFFVIVKTLSWQSKISQHLRKQVMSTSNGHFCIHIRPASGTVKNSNASSTAYLF